LALVFSTGASASAQTLPSLPLPNASAATLPAGVTQVGPYLTTPILLDGATLFRIAAPATVGADQISIQDRAEFIQAALRELLSYRGTGSDSGTLYDPETLRITTESAGSQTIVAAVDSKHVAPLPILTVTSADAQYLGQPVGVVARQWQQTLQSAVIAALQRRQPAAMAHDVGILWRLGAAFVLITAATIAILVTLRKRIAILVQRVEENERKIDTAPSESGREGSARSQRRRRFLGLALRAADPAIALSRLRAIRGILIWFVVLLWFGGLVWALSLFPQTTPLGESIFHRGTQIVFIWIGAAIFVRIFAAIVAQIARAYGARAGKPSSDDEARRVLRVPTISNTAIALAAFVIYFVAMLATLSSLGISAGSVLTLGGLVALAVSLAAQNLVRDFLNGFLVLVEDQYVVGDYVTIGDRSGLVERMTLRVVQLRDNAGNLVTIPHSAATEVINSSRNWSRVDFRIAIDAGSDAKRAIEILRRTATELASDGHWRSAIVEPVEWAGVDSVSTAGIVLRASIKTAPLRQFDVKRELTARMVEALRRGGIALGSKDPYAA
jgi:moderate conductance mechanosensitive channel